MRAYIKGQEGHCGHREYMVTCEGKFLTMQSDGWGLAKCLPLRQCVLCMKMKNAWGVFSNFPNVPKQNNSFDIWTFEDFWENNVSCFFFLDKEQEE